jgi:hypothetical protein
MHAQTAASRTHAHARRCLTLYPAAPNSPTHPQTLCLYAPSPQPPSFLAATRALSSMVLGLSTILHNTPQPLLRHPLNSRMALHLALRPCMQTRPTAALCIALAASSRASTRAARSGRPPCSHLLLLLLKLVDGHAGCARIPQLSACSVAS